MKTFEQFKKEFKELTGIDISSFESLNGLDSNSTPFLFVSLQEEILALHKRIKALEANK